jgi:O-antigen/teichoic acid export membrane protein
MLPITIGTILIADKIILLIYGVEFAGSITALQIIIWALVFTSINIVLFNLLVSINQQKLSTVTLTLGALLNVALNFVLIPMLSYNGAAIATVMTKAIVFGANFYFVSKYLQILSLHKLLVKPLISVSVMGAFVYYFDDFNIFLLIFIAILIYSVSLLILRAFSEEDIDIIKRALYFLKSS